MLKPNLPIAAIPMGSIAAANNVLACESGSFGPTTDAYHNKCECYVSPLMGRKLVKRTILASEDGYDLLENVQPEGINSIRYPDFRNDHTMAGLLCHCAKIWNLVQDVLQSIGSRHTIYSGPVRQKQAESPFVFNRVEVSRCARLADDYGNLHSPQSFGFATANKVNTYTMKRDRVIGHIGSCYRVANFEMADDFAPTRDANLDSVRDAKYTDAVTATNRIALICDALRNNYRITKKF